MIFEMWVKKRNFLQIISVLLVNEIKHALITTESIITSHAPDQQWSREAFHCVIEEIQSLN
jgi:hypothetical protein